MSDEKKKKVVKAAAEKASKAPASAKPKAKASAKSAPAPAKQPAQSMRSKKKQIVAQHGKHANDTGSVKVQIALLTERINMLTLHLQEHKKDNHSRRGLLLLVGQRRRLLNYLKSSGKPEAYEEVIKELELRK